TRTTRILSRTRRKCYLPPARESFNEAIQFHFKKRNYCMGISWNYKGRHALLALFTVLSFAAVSSAQEVNSTATATIKIKNFGQMDERFYRGAQPKEKDYKALAALGVKTVIDLRDDPEDYEKQMVE